MWFGVDAQLEHLSVEPKASATLEAVRLSERNYSLSVLCTLTPGLVALRNAGYQQ